MYLVTGASGFIGKHLLDSLTKRGKRIYCLVYPPSVPRFRDLVAERWPAAKDLFVVLQRQTSFATTSCTCSTSPRSTT